MTVVTVSVQNAASEQMNSSISVFAVSDSAVNVFDGLASLSGDSKLGWIILTGGVAPAWQLSGVNFASYLPALKKIASPYSLVVAGALTAQIVALQNDPHVTAFSVSDTAAHVQNNLNRLQSAAASGKLTSVSLTDVPTPTLTISGAIYGADLDALNAIQSPFHLAVVGALAGQAAALQMDAQVTRFTVSDSAADVQADLDSLQSAAASGKLTFIVLTDAAPTLQLSGAAFASNQLALKRIQSSYSLVVAGASTAQIVALQNDPHVTAFSVSDTAAHVQNNLDRLQSAAASGKLTTVSLTDAATPILTVSGSSYAKDVAALNAIDTPYRLVIADAAVAQLATLAANQRIKSFTISDSAAAVSAALDSLETTAASGLLSAITLTDSGTPTLTLSASSYAADQAVLSDIKSPYTLAVTGATVAEAATLAADPRIASFTISDSAAAVSAALDSLETAAASGQLSAITLTDSGTPMLTLSASSYAADQAVLSDIKSPYQLIVTGATAAQASGLSADPHVALFYILDSAANAQAALESSQIQAGRNLYSITLSDASTPTLTLTSSQLVADKVVLDLLNSSYNLSVSGAVSAASAATLANAHAAPFVVTDTLANIGANLDELEALAKSGEVTGIAVANGGQTLSISASQYASDLDAINILAGSYTITPTSSFQINYSDAQSGAIETAPAAFQHALTTVAAIYGADIANSMTLNLSVYFGTKNGIPLSGAAAGAAGYAQVSYSQMAGLMQANVSGPAAADIAALPAADPFGAGASFSIWDAQAKAWGLEPAQGSESSGVIYCSTGWGTYDSYVNAMLHEVAHAMGRDLSSFPGPTRNGDALSFFDYTPAGQLATSALLTTPPAGDSYDPTYFSVDGGKTDLANFATFSDSSDFAGTPTLGDGVNPLGDPFDFSGYTGVTQTVDLTPLDIVEMGALGYKLSDSALATLQQTANSSPAWAQALGLAAAT